MEILTVHQKGKSQIKSKNRLKIFKKILSSGGISRIELGKHLHLSAASVTRGVEELVRAGLIYEEKKEITFVGRRPVLLNIRKNSCYSMGVHISRRSISLCIQNLLEEVVYESKDSIVGVEYAADLLRILHEMIRHALEKSGISKEKIVSIGLAVRGIVNQERGTVIYSAQTQEMIPIVESVKTLFDGAIFLENNIDVDLKSAYSQEFPHTDELVYVFADEGISGGMISGRRVIRGRNNMAAQFAHLPVEKEGRLCSCGQRGHLQPYFTKSAIEEDYQAQSGEAGVSLISVCDRADKGEETAKRVLQAALEKLAAAMAQVIVLFNPGVVVLCGDIFEHYPDGVAFLRDTVAAQIPIPALLSFDWRVRIQREIRPERNVAKLALEYLLEQ